MFRKLKTKDRWFCKHNSATSVTSHILRNDVDVNTHRVERSSESGEDASRKVFALTLLRIVPSASDTLITTGNS